MSVRQSKSAYLALFLLFAATALAQSEKTSTSADATGKSISAALANSTTTLTVNPITVTQGASVTISVTVGGSGAVPTGTVALKSGTAILANLKLDEGTAAFVASSAPYLPATYPLTAYYAGDGNYATSVSNMVNVTVEPKATTTTTLSVTPNPVVPPGSLSLQAKVVSSKGTPTGTVSFYLGNISLGTAALSGGKATVTSSSSGVAAGTYSTTAKYSGDVNNDSSTSETFDETVGLTSSGSHPPGTTQYIRTDAQYYFGTIMLLLAKSGGIR